MLFLIFVTCAMLVVVSLYEFCNAINNTEDFDERESGQGREDR